MHREFPAKRAGRGFIDFLAITNSGQLVIVETKSGPDSQLALQGLDYWLWAAAHVEELATTFDADPGKRVRIDYVIDSSVRHILSPYTAAQVEALEGSIPWRFRAVECVDSGDSRIVNLELRLPPGRDVHEPFNARRLTPPRYRWAFAPHLARHAPGPVVRGVFLQNPEDGVVPAARHVWRDLQRRGVTHRFANHLRSSQIFAVNLFGLLGGGDSARLLSRWFADVNTAEPPEFEWVRSAGSVGRDEWGARSPDAD